VLKNLVPHYATLFINSISSRSSLRVTDPARRLVEYFVRSSFLGGVVGLSLAPKIDGHKLWCMFAISYSRQPQLTSVW
jgi:hypothetical protein